MPFHANRSLLSYALENRILPPSVEPMYSGRSGTPGNKCNKTEYPRGSPGLSLLSYLLLAAFGPNCQPSAGFQMIGDSRFSEMLLVLSIHPARTFPRYHFQGPVFEKTFCSSVPKRLTKKIFRV